MDTIKRKELRNAYKDKAIIGGIYCIHCKGNNRSWIKSTRNLPSQQNKFQFAISINSCLEPGMRNEWAQYGPQSFSLTILEMLEKKETQTEQEFAEDINVLLEMWMEKYKQDA